jgi:dual oxidase
MVRDRNNLLWFSDLLNYISTTASSSSSHHSNVNFRITTHVTQKRKQLSTHISRWLLEKHRTPEHPESPITGLINPTHFGRPDMKMIMNTHYMDMCQLLAAKKDLHKGDKKKMEESRDGFEVGVFFCGAPVVGYQLADACRALTARGREEKTFVEYHFMMEVFG